MRHHKRKCRVMSEKKKTAADKIIQGLKDAIAFAKCEHDWDCELVVVGFNGATSITRKCWLCGCQEIKFV